MSGPYRKRGLMSDRLDGPVNSIDDLSPIGAMWCVRSPAWASHSNRVMDHIQTWCVTDHVIGDRFIGDTRGMWKEQVRLVSVEEIEPDPYLVLV